MKMQAIIHSEVAFLKEYLNEVGIHVNISTKGYFILNRTNAPITYHNTISDVAREALSHCPPGDTRDFFYEALEKRWKDYPTIRDRIREYNKKLWTIDKYLKYFGYDIEKSVACYYLRDREGHNCCDKGYCTTDPRYLCWWISEEPAADWNFTDAMEHDGLEFLYMAENIQRLPYGEYAPLEEMQCNCCEYATFCWNYEEE